LLGQYWDYSLRPCHYRDRLQREREQALADFKAGISLVLVATSVAARGLDIPSVDHVVNYDMPQSIDDYVHRIGRTGRCGNLGRATSFFDREANGDLARALVKILSEVSVVLPYCYPLRFGQVLKLSVRIMELSSLL